MDSLNITSKQQVKELLDAQAHIWNHNSSYLNSMALKCAVHLGIPDVIEKHGKPMTLNELAKSLGIHPTKTPFLPRLMRLLCHNKFFSKHNLPNGEIGFGLTLNSQLLLKDHPFSQAPQIYQILEPVITEPAHHLKSWFQNEDETPFHIVHGRSIWEHASFVPQFNELFTKAMASDAKLVASLIMANDEAKGIFEGVKSLVDVGGGDGTLAKAISKAYPELKCMVLDLPHVVKGLQGDGYNLVYVPGDMFARIPQTQVVLLKWILHDWSDQHCINILERCKEAIPKKDQGGKVIIIDMVLNENNDGEHSSTQFLFDLQMMSITVGGKQRTQEEWKKLFLNAGFNDYKFFPILGLPNILPCLRLNPPFLYPSCCNYALIIAIMP